MRKDGLQKLYYSIREVTELTGVEAHVLRFWEKEISLLKPRRGRSGNRAYKERDIQIVFAIKDLLYNQKYTIQGASDRLRNERHLWEDQPVHTPASLPSLEELRQIALELKRLVDGEAAASP